MATRASKGIGQAFIFAAATTLALACSSSLPGETQNPDSDDFIESSEDALSAPTGRCRTDTSKDPGPRAAGVSAAAAMGAPNQGTDVSPITVHVRWHVIHNGARGNIGLRRIKKQIEVLNKAYAGEYGDNHVVTPFRFVLDDVERVDNKDWFNLDIPEKESIKVEREFKKGLRSGDATTLNIYSVKLGDFLGWAYMPWNYEVEPMMDGIVLDYRTLPEGSLPLFNEGDTLTHEVGHWLGLNHTFDGGCGEVGDGVTDTPAERIPARTDQCQTTRNTCPQFPGDDPVKNFMDYSADSCMNEFSQGQSKRATAMWYAFRNPSW